VVLGGFRLFQIVGSQSIDIPRNHLEPSETIWNHLEQEEKSG
jgi:hypothetical protein